MKKQICTLAACAAAFIISGCDSASSFDAALSTFEETEQKVITIDGGKYSAAAFQGADEDGKTKEEYLIGLAKGAQVNVFNAPITSKDTSSNIWVIGIGYSDRPHIACNQSEDWAKQELLKIKGKTYEAKVYGTYRGTYGNTIELQNCTVEL